MGFRRALRAALERGVVFACGVGVVFALEARLYACAIVLLLIGLWSMARGAWAERTRPGLPGAPPPPAPATSEVELRLLRSLLDQTPAPLVMLHPDGVIRAGNRAARRLFQTDDRLLEPPPELAAALSQNEPERRLTIRLDSAEGPHAYAVSIADLVGPRGAIRLAALLDIQPEIRAAEAAALRDLMQVLSHEIMNALTPVTSLAATARDLLSEETSQPARLARDAVATLARRAEGLSRFVDAYRTLARLPPPVLAPVSLGALLDEVAQLFRSRWSVQLTVARPDPDVIVDLDLDLMVHALSNILSNAADVATRITLTALVDDGHARLVIEDNGPGVRPSDRDLIFRPFYTTKPEGSGVGLSFARQVALSHGGDLVLAASSPEGGARFVLGL